VVYYYVMLRKRKILNADIDLDELKELANRNPAAVWVNLLLLHMYKSNLESFTLKKSEGIPLIPHRDEVPEGELDFTKIINRLKVMSGLDPVVYKEQHEGKISLCFCGIWHNVKTTFIDSDDDSTCVIIMSKGEAREAASIRPPG
jgi:hypothetical protein